jgi:hypothetical protein
MRLPAYDNRIVIVCIIILMTMIGTLIHGCTVRDHEQRLERLEQRLGIPGDSIITTDTMIHYRSGDTLIRREVWGRKGRKRNR